MVTFLHLNKNCQTNSIILSSNIYVLYQLKTLGGCDLPEMLAKCRVVIQEENRYACGVYEAFLAEKRF